MCKQCLLNILGWIPSINVHTMYVFSICQKAEMYIMENSMPFQVVQAHPQEAPRVDRLHSSRCNLRPPRQNQKPVEIQKIRLAQI